MFVLFRADSSSQLGAGHIMRCLTLANELRSRGAKVQFVCRDLIGNMAKIIEASGIPVTLIPGSESGNLAFDWSSDAKNTINAIGRENIDWCVVDHYEIDEKWQKEIAGYAKKIFVIDDIPDRFFSCDILLDQTYGRKISDYKDHVPGDCNLLIGSVFALLRPEFRELRSAAKKKRHSNDVKNILITMGGTDVSNYTSIALEVLNKLNWQEKPSVDIVLNSAAPGIKEVEKQILDTAMEVNLHLDADNMAEMMLNADLAIGAGGSTSWERCCLGLPSIVVITAENQRDIVLNLEKAGAVLRAQEEKTEFKKELKKQIKEILEHREIPGNLSVRAFQICDGSGVNKCADKIYNLLA